MVGTAGSAGTSRLEEVSARVRGATSGLLPEPGAPVRPPDPDPDTGWVSAPEQTGEAVLDATGRGWDDWRRIIDAWPGHDEGHAAVARYLEAEHGVPGWWAQSVTVGWERITGRRLPHQRADGTFSAGRSRTITADAAQLREWLLDEAARASLFPGDAPELRSRPTSRYLRLALGTGTAQLSVEPAGEGRVKVTVEHAQLRSPGEVEAWRAYWAAWLAAVDEP